MSALYKIEQAKMLLGSVNAPALCYINMAQPLIEDDRTKTLMLDAHMPGQLYLVANSRWVDMMDLSDLAKVLYIEASRIALHHVTKRAVDNKFNLLSSDIICYAMARGCLTLTGTSFPDALDKSKANVYYEQGKVLYKNETGKEWDGDCDYHEKVAMWMERAANNSDGGDPDDSDQSETSGGEGENSDGPGTPQEALEDYFCDDTRSDNWTPNETVASDIAMETKHLEENGGFDGTSWGLSAGDILMKILAAQKPPVDHRRIIRSFIGTVVSQRTESTRMRQNRRYNLLFPGQRSVYDCKLLLAADSSGSMSDEDLSAAACLIAKIATGSQIDFSWWDCKCTLPMTFKPGGSRKNFDVTGRGGTNPQCVFDMLRDNKLVRKYSGIIIFSDMIFDEIPKPREIPVDNMLWICTADGSNPPRWVPRRRIMRCKEIMSCIKKDP